MVVDKDRIFKGVGMFRNVDIMELLMALVSPEVSLEDKRAIWHLWESNYYSKDTLIEFFSDSLFSSSGMSYIDVFLKTKEYKNFYELALSLDMANIDCRAYYLFWILSYGHEFYSQLVKDAFEYDPDTIRQIFPDIEDVLFVEGGI